MCKMRHLTLEVLLKNVAKISAIHGLYGKVSIRQRLEMCPVGHLYKYFSRLFENLLRTLGGYGPRSPLDAQALSGLQNVPIGHVFHCYG